MRRDWSKGSAEVYLAAGTGKPEATKTLTSPLFDESCDARNTVSIKSSCGPAVWLVSGLDLC